MKKALIIVDMQEDFCPGGPLPVPEGDLIVPEINRVMVDYDVIVATKDWHPSNHSSFKEFGGPWEPHCIENTPGAELHKVLDTSYLCAIIHKGLEQGIDSYSAFIDNDKQNTTGLAGLLHEKEVKKVAICGLALDYCVYFTAMDAKKLDFEVEVLLKATRGVDFPEGNINKTMMEMEANGIILT